MEERLREEDLCNGSFTGQAYAFYRLPDARSYHYIAQKGVPASTPHFPFRKETAGFVIAPFSAGGNAPYVTIVPDASAEFPIPTGECSPIGCVLQDEASERLAYHQAFFSCQQELQAGHCKKIVLSRRKQVRLADKLSPRAIVELFHKACRLYPHSYIALWDTPATGCWLTASPELLLRHDGKTWHTMALAGTMDKDAPEAKSADTWSKKNREEQRIVADYIRQHLQQAAMAVEESPTRPVLAVNVMHLRTDFSFEVADADAPFSILESLHPTPAVCGLPCAQVHSTIVRAEQHSRRYYAGFSGPLNLMGETGLYVSLRCMELKERIACLYAGGGLLSTSREEEEWEETDRKMQTMWNLLTKA